DDRDGWHTGARQAAKLQIATRATGPARSRRPPPTLRPGSALVPATRSAREPTLRAGIGTLPHTPAPPLLLPRAFAILAQADFEEDEDHHAYQPDRQQGGGENLARRSCDERRAHHAGDGQRTGESEREHAGPRAHGSKVPVPAPDLPGSRRQSCQGPSF